MDEINYSILDLLHLLKSEHGEKLEIRVGLAPILVIKDKDFEIEGPPVTETGAKSLFHKIAETRQVRDFRQRGIAEFIYTFENARFRVRAIKEFGYVQLDFHSVAA
ncbi:MAG: hypothetical protein ABI042_16990 [Verrucomicrobiota bacterium]